MNIQQSIMQYQIQIDPRPAIVYARIGLQEVGEKYASHDGDQEKALEIAVAKVMLLAAQIQVSPKFSVAEVERLAALMSVTYPAARKALMQAVGNFETAIHIIKGAKDRAKAGQA